MNIKRTYALISKMKLIYSMCPDAQYDYKLLNECLAYIDKHGRDKFRKDYLFLKKKYLY